MIVVRTLAELAEARAGLPGKVVFVATMGALHAGHRSLIKLAHSRGDAVVVSIFVNPLQFGPGEDYARYPRPIEDDLDVCRHADVDVAFVPTVTELYPAGRQVTVSAGAIGTVLEGASRPGHFDGVLTVVLKLLNVVRPDVAILGEKDAQQLACVRRMVVDLNVPVEIVGAPTVREVDGLALSSRNRYLSVPDRILATSLSVALHAGAAQRTAENALAAAQAVLTQASTDPSFSLDYLALVQPSTFAEVPVGYVGDALLVVAARIGTTRLIDNMAVSLRPDEPAVPQPAAAPSPVTVAPAAPQPVGSSG